MSLPVSDAAAGPGAWLPLWAWVWLAAALIAIFQTGPMPMYSTRTLGVAWEMWTSGQFLLPLNNGEPYSHKVPLLFWLIHAGWAVAGVNAIWPRLLEVGLGLITLLLARRLAQKLFPERPQVARLTPWLLAAFAYAFLFGLQIMYETLLSVCVLAAINALVGRGLDQRPRFFGFALAVGAGLLAKGPVMLLHVFPVFLLGPLWHPWARRQRGRWYALGTVALVAGVGLLLMWAIPAALVGGEAYRNELFFMQTAGRVVDSFDHAQPWWWYASVLPGLMLPWLLWPRAWQAAVGVLVQPRQPGLRFIACWLLPVLIGFSLVSGKQAYYLLPELAGVALWLAAGLPRNGRFATRSWSLSGNLLPALATFALAGLVLLAPGWVAEGRINDPSYIDLAGASPWFAVAAAVIGMALLLPTRSVTVGVAQLGSASLALACLAYVLFAHTLWPRFDLSGAAARIAELQGQGRPVAHFHLYENQFQFLGRLRQPLAVLDPGSLDAWVHAHPDGYIVHGAETLGAEDLIHADWVQPFRSSWLLIEAGPVWLARLQGRVPPTPTRPAIRFPADYWQFGRVPGLAGAAQDDGTPTPQP